MAFTPYNPKQNQGFTSYSDFLIAKQNEPKKSLFQQRVDKGADIIEKGAKGERTNTEVGIGLIGQGAGYIGDLAGKAISAVTPDVIGDMALKPIKAIAESPVGEFIGDTYNKLPERAKDNLEAVGNIAGLLPVGKGAQLGVKGATKAVGGTAKGVSTIATETLGKTTGTGSGVLRAGFNAVREGGDSAEAFSRAIKGELSPAQIVEEAKGALGKMKQQRTDEYVSRLEKLKQSKETLDVSPVVKEVDNQLNKFGVLKTPQGLDFSRSTLRFDKKAQQEIQTIVDEMASFGLREGDRTVIGVDSLKRALADLYSDSSSARAFTQAVSSKTRDILGKVEGYDDLTKNYALKTDVINDVTKSLSLGDKASIDTAFKKLNSSLRTNNEARQQLIKELDEVAGTKLSAKIAGQQLSEKLPRGLMGTVTSTGVIGGAFAGMSIPLLLTAAITTSPRIVGEIIRGLGYTARQTDKIVNYLRNSVSKPSTAIPSNANIPTSNINVIPE